MYQKLPFWQNWARNVQSHPSEIHYPSSEAEIVALIQRANKEALKIRVIGNGHSFTALGKTKQLLLSLEKMTGLIEMDAEKQEVSVWAGTSIKKLNELLFEQGFNLMNLGDIDVQSIAGATATGTHGTGVELGNVSSQITAFTLVDAQGEIRNCSPTENKELFQAGRIALGTLGIITRIRLKVVPAYKLEYRSKKAKLEDTLERLEEYNANNRNFEFYWFPYTKTVQLKFSNITDLPIKDNPTMRYINEQIMENAVFQFLCNIGKNIKSSFSVLSKIAGLGVSSEHKINHSHKIYATERKVRFKEMEYNIPYENFKEVMRRIVQKIKDERYRVYFPVECRFVQQDDIWLSPAYQRKSAYIAVHVDHRTPHNPYFKDIEAIFKEYGGRPHWGKMNTRKAENLATAYPKWEDFCRLRSTMDPQGMFLNEYLQELFGVEKTAELLNENNLSA